LRSGFPGLSDRMPFVGWIQDRLPRLFDPGSVAALGDRDVCYGMWPSIVEECRAHGYPWVETLPAAVNHRRFATEPRTRAEYEAEVAFVSNVARPQPEALIPLVECYIREHGYGHGQPQHYAALRRFLEGRGLVVPAERRASFEQQLYVGFERYLQRREVLRWVRDAGFDLRLFGRGWESDPEFASHARGPVEPGEDLRDLYHSARVHLQINLDTNLHARVFECLAAGGAILAAETPDDHRSGGLGDHLEIGSEILTFGDRTSCLALIDDLLQRPDHRDAHVDAGRRRVLAEHTYVHRARRIIDDVRRALRPPTPSRRNVPQGACRSPHSGRGPELPAASAPAETRPVHQHACVSSGAVVLESRTLGSKAVSRQTPGAIA
ncbi:MAG: glycosyltransferase, partial [Planctomycetes bacterium]|nr:glycosyltransferase [Planctomycetota bacterium]